LLAFEYLAGIAAALVLSPTTWYGQLSEPHIHVWAAVFLGGPIVALPIGFGLLNPGRQVTRHTIAVGQMLMSALLIHLSGGRIETHFHIFGSLAFLSFYRDWRVLITASAIVAADHFLRGLYWPQSVYGSLSPGSWRWLEHTGWVIFEDVFLCLAISQSVREMRSMAEQTAELEKTNEARDAFLSVCSHELKTPLTSLKLHAQIGLRSFQDGEAGPTPERTRRFFEVTATQLARISRTVDDMLDISRIQGGNLSLQSERVDLATLTRATVDRFLPEFTRAGCEVTLEADEAVEGHWDPYRIEQVLVNLLTNCIKYAAGRPVRIVVSADAREARLRVEDRGDGIAAEDQARVFRRFERASNDRSISGLGLGLYIASSLVEQHGGTIGLESESGRGSTFTVTLPREDSPTAPAVLPG